MTLKELLKDKAYTVKHERYNTRLTRRNCGSWEKYDIKDENTSKLILSAHKQDTRIDDPLIRDNMYKVFVDDQELTEVEQPVLEHIFCDVCRLYKEQKGKKAEEAEAKIKQKTNMLYQELFKQMQK